MQASQIIEMYIEEINNDFEISKLIIAKVGKEDENIVRTINHSTIITICIKYESFTGELMNYFIRRKISYNRPWTYTRFFMAKFQNICDFEQIYHNAHDVWEYYNALKHVNQQSKIEILKFNSIHRIRNSWDALRFAHKSLIELLQTLLSCAKHQEATIVK